MLLKLGESPNFLTGFDLAMARPHYGPEAKKQAKRLFEALLAYANDELENGEHLKIQVNWQNENQLVVRTKVRFLEQLTALDPYDGKLNSNQIKQALKRLANFLGILTDNRPGTKGLHDWHFTLKLWHHRYEKQANLQRFDVEWENRRAKKSLPASRSQTLGNLGTVHRFSPSIYNERGVDNYLSDQLPLVINNFTEALKLEPNFAETHYNLGVFYEDLRDFDRARSEYRLAMQDGLAAAYNNQARLSILEKDYAAAVDLLLKGLKLAKHNAEKYAFWKNLGWVRQKQGRHREAKDCLISAIELEKEQASAYCLLAQTLDNLGEKTEAYVTWENCLRYASSYRPDEDAWIDLARQHLAQTDS